MQIQNFQQRAWIDLFTRVIDNLAEEASFTFSTSDNNAGEEVKVDFAIPEETKQVFLDIASVSNQKTTSFADLKVQVTLQYLGVKASQIIKLIELPRLAQGGLLINGCRWSLINTMHPASGWYVEPAKKKPGVYNLNLHRGAGTVLSIQPDKIAKNTKAADRNYVVRMRSRAGTEYTIPLAEFLVALTCDATVNTKNIVDKAGLADCEIFANTFKKAQNVSSERLEELCIKLVRRLRSKSDQYVPMSATAELKSLLRNNYLNIGPERIPRFKRFTSFYRGIGTELSKGVNIETRDGERHVVTDSSDASPFGNVKDTYGRSTIISETIAHDLDSVVDLYEIEVNKNGHTFKLVRMPELTEEITFEEICCALRVYDQVMRGIGSPDDIDDTCNKVMHSIREEFSSYIETAFSKCANAIKQCIRKCSARAESNTNIVQAVIRDFENVERYSIDAATISKKIVGSSCYQQIDETNSLASYDQSYRITSTAANVTNKARDIHPLQYGRICSYTTSESKQVGLNLDMTLGCEIDEYGFCTTPTYEINPNNPPDKRIGKKCKMSAVDEISAVIAPADADITGDPTTMIPGCRVNGDFKTMPLAEVTHIMANNLQTVGPLIASVPAQNMNAGKRSVMSVSAQRQALIPWRCERPLVSTGIDAICDIGIQRASTLVEDYIHTNKDASRDYELAGTLPDTLTVVRSTHENGDFVVHFSFILNGNSYSFISRHHAPSATMKGSLKYTRFNNPRHDKMSYYFKMDDIVFYNSDVDMETAIEIDGPDDSIDFGGALRNCSTAELKSHGVAIGANVNVMFKSLNGYTYEDSIVVNEDFLARQGLAIVKTKTLSYTLGKNRVIDNRHNNAHMQCGLPLNGSFVQPGQEVLAVRIVDENADAETAEDRTYMYTLAVGTQGYILSHEVIRGRQDPDSTTVLIHLGEILPIGIGDKLTGLHGNKGVVGRVMKSSEMPFTEDGTVADIILNPLGILARLNIGQIIEFSLGGISRKTGKLEILEPFSSKGNIQSILKHAEELGCVEQDVYSGTTGLKLERKALVGSMYFLRVEHTSTSKYNATGDCHENISNRTNQPMRCSGGAQRISEMGTWCLLSMNATKLLDSLFSVQSDSEQKRAFDKILSSGGATGDISISSSNLDMVRAYFYMLGLNIDVYKEGDQSATGVRFLTRDDMNARAGVDLAEGSTKGLVSVNRGLKASVALHDQKLFGTAITPANMLTKCYGKLPFGTGSDKAEIVMPALLHTNNLPQLIRAVILRYKNDEIEMLQKSMDKKLFSDIISCSLRTGSAKPGAALVGWTKPIVKDPERIAKLKSIGIELPEDLEDLRVPVIIKITNTADREALEDAALALVDHRFVAHSEYGIQAVVEIFKYYNLFTSLFDMVFESDTAQSVHLVTDAPEADVTEKLSVEEDALATDLVSCTSDRDIDIDVVAEERAQAESLADAAIDDDRDIGYAANNSVEVEEEEVTNLDSANIEIVIPAFRGIIMMLTSYPAAIAGRVLENFVMDGMLVPPAKFRPVVAADTKKNSPIDVCLNAIYTAAVNMIGATDKAKESTALYNIVKYQEITGMDKRAPSLINQLKDHKSGTSLLRDTNLSKRVTYSARSVISIGRDLQLGECGVPVCMLTTIFMNRLAFEYSSRKIFGVTKIALNNLKRALVCLSNKNLYGFRQIFEEVPSDEGAIKLSKITVSEFNRYYAGLVAILNELLKEQPCIPNREPSLHKFSLQGAMAKPVDGYTLLLHPLNCHGYNADFDGDQMAVIFPMHEAGKKDTEENVMSRKNLVDPKDSSGIVAINQDMILGLYYATIHEKNVKDTPTYYSRVTYTDIKKCYTLPVYGSKACFSNPKGHSFGVAEAIMDDITAGVVRVHDMCLVKYGSSTYLAEAGKIVVNALLPGGTGFTSALVEPLVRTVLENKATSDDLAVLDSKYPADSILRHIPICKLKITSQLTKKSIGKVLTDAIDYFSDYGLEEDEYGDHLADFYNRLMNTGFIMADISGITLSLYDFGRLPVKEQIKPNLEKTKHDVAVLDTWHDLGFCTDTEYQAAKDKLWVDNVMTSKDIIKHKFADADSANALHSLNPDDFDRNSNIFMIIDSGARGDVSQLLEMAGMIGVVRNSANQQLKDPIFASYMDGLSPMDFAANACTARRQIAAAQLTTADSGAETRDLIYLGEHLHIRNDNYCCKNDDSKHLLHIPCKYIATAEPEENIYWFTSNPAASDHAANTRVETIRTETQLRAALTDALQEPELNIKKMLLMCDDHYYNLRQDLDALRDGKPIPYVNFLHRLSMAGDSSSECISDTELAGLCYQKYSYVVKTELIVDEAGNTDRRPIAYGVRLYDLKLAQLTKDMLLWRITKADEIENSPLTTSTGNKLVHVQPDDILTDDEGYQEVDPEVLEDSDVIIDSAVLRIIEQNVIREVPIYSMINCTSTEGICRKCFGITYDSFKLPRKNALIGYSGIQAIANPMTQLILDSHKSEYSGEESAMSKLQRVTSQRHAPQKITGDMIKRITEGKNSTGMPYLGFAVGEKTIVALDPAAEKGKYIISVIDLWHLAEDGSPYISITSFCAGLNALKIAPTVLDGKIISRDNTVDVLMKALETSTIERGTAITDITDYGKYMGCAYDLVDGKCDNAKLSALASESRFEYWESLCKCFTNDTILSRNFETFARALTEFGIADETDVVHGIVKGYTYDISLLNAVGIRYIPVIERRNAARTLAGKIYTDIAFGNPLAHIMYHAVNGTVENKNTYIGKEVLGVNENTATRVTEFPWHAKALSIFSGAANVPTSYPSDLPEEFTNTQSEPTPEVDDLADDSYDVSVNSNTAVDTADDLDSEDLHSNVFGR